MNAAFRAANRAYDDMSLNAHLRDWDVSEARDRAIEARTRELLDGDYTPFGERVVDDFCGWTDLTDVLGEMLPHLMAGDEAEAGRIVTQRLRRFARSQAEAEARIQVDREHETSRDDCFFDRRRHP